MTEAPEEAAPAPAALAVRPSPQAEGLSLAVEQWARAWFAGNLEAMYAGLHPSLVRHVLGTKTAPTREALQRLLGVQSLFGRAVHGQISPSDVKVLDVQGRSGSARVELGPWTAFIHLAAHHGGWAIANVLWEWRSGGGSGR